MLCGFLVVRFLVSSSRTSYAYRTLHIHDVSGNSRERSKEVSSLGKNSDGEALQNIINQLSDVENLRDLNLKHYHMSSAQFRREQLTWIFLERFMTFCQHVVKICPFCNSSKPRPDRSHVSGLRAEKCGDPIILDHGRGDQTFGFRLFWKEAHHI